MPAANSSFVKSRLLLTGVSIDSLFLWF